MTRLIMITILAVVVPAALFAQIGWIEHNIADNFDDGRSVFAIDLDDDGDVDVLGAAASADDITWWENLNGLGTSWAEHPIDTLFDGALSVFAIDLDDDGDVDVLGAAASADDITWWENLNGLGTSWAKHPIDTLFDGAFSVFAIDLDDDGDVDILGAAASADDITWWENNGASPPNFTEHNIADNFDCAYSVYAIDLDDDGDVDVLGAATSADDITWWENLNGLGTSWAEHPIDTLFDGALSVFAIDLDDDEDVDVLGAAGSAGDITWWENNGASPPNFTEHNIADNFDGATSVYAIDLDDDGDVDVLGAARNADDITWWENDLMGMHELVTVTPNAFMFRCPTICNGSTEIEFTLPMATKVDLLVYDLAGRLSKTIVSKSLPAGKHRISVNLNLPTGVYFYKLNTESGENVMHKFLIIE